MGTVATIGHNQPPLDQCLSDLENLTMEARNWADGVALDSDEQHDAVTDLIGRVRAAKKAADDQRKKEAKPFDEGKKAVQEKFNPFLKSADTAIKTLNEVVAPYLKRKDDERRKAEQEARAEADQLKREADQALQSRHGNLAEREAAETALKQAKVQEASANRIAKTNVAKGARTQWVATIADYTAALRIAVHADPDAFEDLILQVGNRLAREVKGPVEGFTVTETKAL